MVQIFLLKLTEISDYLIKSWKITILKKNKNKPIVTLLPKTFGMSHKVVNVLLKDYDLSDKEIAEIRVWNGHGSPYKATIIFTGNVEQRCYPFTGDIKEFLEFFPNGKQFVLRD